METYAIMDGEGEVCGAMSDDKRGIEPYTDVDIEIQGYGSQSEPAPELEGRDDVPADPFLGRSQWAIKEYTVDGSSEE